MLLAKPPLSIPCFTKQYQLFLLALSFFTRIPVKLPFEIKPEMLHQASRYFALVGLLIGGICALFYCTFNLIFPQTIAILLTMAVNLILTGAFHEDGWSDVWDGFGGGWSITDKLNIMKDSRLGTYGAAALFIILVLKYQTLSTLHSPVIALIVAHTLSRIVATSLIFTMPYVTEGSQTKVKPVVQELSTTSLLILISTGALLLIALLGLHYGDYIIFSFSHALWLIGILLIVRFICSVWFKQQLGGYTGDCLGAAQQLSEVVIYLTFLALPTSFYQGLS